jgi:hypothetical protein
MKIAIRERYTLAKQAFNARMIDAGFAFELNGRVWATERGMRSVRTVMPDFVGSYYFLRASCDWIGSFVSGRPSKLASSKNVAPGTQPA